MEVRERPGLFYHNDPLIRTHQGPRRTALVLSEGQTPVIRLPWLLKAPYYLLTAPHRGHAPTTAAHHGHHGDLLYFPLQPHHLLVFMFPWLLWAKISLPCGDIRGWPKPPGDCRETSLPEHAA